MSPWFALCALLFISVQAVAPLESGESEAPPILAGYEKLVLDTIPPSGGVGSSILLSLCGVDSAFL